jgi:hypothetical protein
MKRTLISLVAVAAFAAVAQVTLSNGESAVSREVVIARSVLNYDVATGNLLSLDVVTREVTKIDGALVKDAPYRTLSYTPAQVAAASTNFAATAAALRALVNHSLTNLAQ